jgi:S-(hydroxymethyl)glutathione dehydrogenase / alcohol dehydrogenase
VKAAVLYEYGSPLVIEELELESPRVGEILVRMVASGVCHSDLHSVQGVHPGPMPAVIGHEGAGVVEEVGPGVTTVAPGDHVILTWLPYCGACAQCLRGRANLCERLAWSDSGHMMDGTVRLYCAGKPIHHYTTSSFAELAVVPEQTAIKVEAELPLTELALMGCAVMTGVGAVINTARVRPGDTVAVVGCGGVGLNIVQGAAIANASRIVAIDVEPVKLDLAAQLGATQTILASEGDPVDAIVAGGGLVDFAFEAIGRPSTIELATRLSRPGGEAILVGMAPPDTRVSFNPLDLTTGEKVIRGSWYGSCRPPIDFPILLDLYRAGRLRLDLLVTPCTLDEVNDALDAIETGRVARSVIVF